MSAKHFDERITSRYGEPEKELYKQVIDLVKKNNLAKSRAQLLLVERGLQHTHNPEPIIKEIPKDRYPYCKDCKGEPIGVDDHITEQPASRGQAQDSGQGKSAPNPALGVKKSPKEEKGIGGWIALGGFLALIFGPVVYSWFTK